MFVQPVLCMGENECHTYELSAYAGCFYYTLHVKEQIQWIPDNCADLLWNEKNHTLLSFEYVQYATTFCAEETDYIGIHVDCHYLYTYDEKQLKDWFSDMFFKGGREWVLAGCETALPQLLQLRSVSPFMRKCLGQVEQSAGRLSVEMIAENIGYTPRHMQRVFHSQFAYGPKAFCRYYNLCAVINAMQKQPQENVMELLRYTVYTDASHFQRDFKKYIGMTPKQFRSCLK